MNKLTTLSLLGVLVLSVTGGVASANSDAATEDKAKPVEGMLLPFMNPAKGRLLYASKGCVVCHAINGVGGEDAPPLDASTMPQIMDPFDFAAKMWRGAGTMIALQEDELGEQIDFTGEELANIIAFVHSPEEQKKFSKADIPPNIEKLMGHGSEDEDEDSEKKDHD